MSHLQSTDKLAYPYLWQGLAVILLAAIALGSLAPISIRNVGFSIPNIDKLQHLAAYALLTAWYRVVFPGRYNDVAIPAFVLGIGALLEWLQGMTGYRDASMGDMLANTIGTIIAAVFLTQPLLQGLLRIEKLFSGTRYTRKRRSLRYRAIWQIIGMHLAVVLLISAFTPLELGGIGIPHIDKIIHFFTYGGLTAWFLLVTRIMQAKLLIILAMCVLSISVEMLQGLTRFGGEPSALDAAADAAGILLATLFIISPLRKLLVGLERLFRPKNTLRRRRARHSIASRPNPKAFYR